MIGLPRLHQLALTAWHRTLATTTDPYDGLALALDQLQSDTNRKDPPMTTISDQDRAEAQAMLEAFHGCGTLPAMSDDNVRRWRAARDHVLASHECPTVPVWRPTTAAEIQPGWEVRSRRRNGSESAWGVAHHRDLDGDWRTEAGVVLTYAAMGWTYETTAPLPDPWDEALVGVVSDALAGTEDPGPHWADDARRVLDALAARGYLERAAITGGERS